MFPESRTLPPVAREKPLYRKHWANSCCWEPLSAGWGFIWRKSIRKNKHSRPCVYTALGPGLHRTLRPASTPEGRAGWAPAGLSPRLLSSEFLVGAKQPLSWPGGLSTGCPSHCFQMGWNSGLPSHSVPVLWGSPLSLSPQGPLEFLGRSTGLFVFIKMLLRGQAGGWEEARGVGGGRLTLGVGLGLEHWIMLKTLL